MEIEEKTEGDVTTLFLKGRMLGGEADKLLREKVEGLVEAGRVNIILDMAGVPDIDSLCLGEILRSGRQVEACESERENSRLADENQVYVARRRRP
jgi:anti-anti-sigma regulatory factor